MKLASQAVEIHVTDQGEGSPVLVFLHYWGGSSRTWDAVVAQLPDRYRSVRPDLRGWGNSQPHSVVGYSLDDFALDVTNMIERLKLDRYVLVGHSMGGKIAQLLASRHPAGLAGLILIAPAPPGPLAMPTEALEAMATAYESEQSVEMAIDHMLTVTPLSPQHRQQVIEDSMRGAPAAKAAWPKLTSRQDITREVLAIDVPTAIIAGELDKVDSVATLEAELLTRIPHAAFHKLKGAGHLSPLESPGEIAAIIQAFVENVCDDVRT